MNNMPEFLQDAHGWVAISFVIFAIAAYFLGKGAVLSKLDGRITQIRRDIETASALRLEAQGLVENYQQKHKDAAREAETIVAHARQSADEIRKQAVSELDDAIKRREAQLQERLRRMEEAAVNDIRAYAAELTIKATTEIIADKMDDKINAQLVDQSVKKLAGQLG